MAPLAESGRRARYLTEAMRPAELTHLWAAANLDAAAALDGVALIEASHEAEEALAIAAALRETLAVAGRTAALVTPDPAIARRVAAELTRWGIDVENSAGLTLGATEEGIFARLAVAAAREFSAPRVAASLASPRTRLGRTAEGYALAARALELGVLRAPLPVSGLQDAAAAFAAAREAAASPYAHRATRTLSDEASRRRPSLLADLVAALAPLQAADGGPLAELVAAHAEALVALAAPDAPGDAVADLLDEWALAAGEGFHCSLGDYAAMFETLAAQRAPPNPRGHPRLAVLGLLEARLLDFDRGDSRRARRDGLAARGAHRRLPQPPDARRSRPVAAGAADRPDRAGFRPGAGTRDAIVTRCAKRDGSPTVASRFLRRIEALAGPEKLKRLSARGRFYLDVARHLDRPAPAPPATRPAPKPPVELRPQKLSVTRIETLRRDPYAIYAERILKLAPLPPVAPDLAAAGSAMSGTARLRPSPRRRRGRARGWRRSPRRPSRISTPIPPSAPCAGRASARRWTSSATSTRRDGTWRSGSGSRPRAGSPSHSPTARRSR